MRTSCSPRTRPTGPRAVVHAVVAVVAGAAVVVTRRVEVDEWEDEEELSLSELDVLSDAEADELPALDPPPETSFPTPHAMPSVSFSGSTCAGRNVVSDEGLSLASGVAGHLKRRLI